MCGASDKGVHVRYVLDFERLNNLVGHANVHRMEDEIPRRYLASLYGRVNPMYTNAENQVLCFLHAPQRRWKHEVSILTYILRK